MNKAAQEENRWVKGSRKATVMLQKDDILGDLAG